MLARFCLAARSSVAPASVPACRAAPARRPALLLGGRQTGPRPNMAGGRSCSSVRVVRADQNVRRQFQQRTQPANHRERERPFSVRHLDHSVPRPDGWLKITAREAFLLHHESNGFNGVWRLDGETGRLVCFNQRHQKIQPIAFRRSGLGVHQAFDLTERLGVVGVRLDRSNVHHLYLIGVDAIIWSRRGINKNGPAMGSSVA